jgi:hypothetical protein
MYKKSVTVLIWARISSDMITIWGTSKSLFWLLKDLREWHLKVVSYMFVQVGKPEYVPVSYGPLSRFRTQKDISTKFVEPV